MTAAASVRSGVETAKQTTVDFVKRQITNYSEDFKMFKENVPNILDNNKKLVSSNFVTVRDTVVRILSGFMKKTVENKNEDYKSNLRKKLEDFLKKRLENPRGDSNIGGGSPSEVEPIIELIKLIFDKLNSEQIVSISKELINVLPELTKIGGSKTRKRRNTRKLKRKKSRKSKKKVRKSKKH